MYIIGFTTEIYTQPGNIRFEILNDDNGLSNNTVNAIEQDSLGFLWFATDYGVNKYDGYKFNVFTSNPADSFSIPHNKVRALYTDSQNRLWLGTSGGLSNYDHRKEQFINYLPEFYVRAFAESEPGILWLGTSKGLIKFNAASGNYKHYNLAPDYAEENGKYSIIALAFDYEGYLWIATDGQGVFRFESESETFKNYSSGNSANSISSDVVLCVYEDSKKRLWFGTRDGLNLYDRKKDNFVIFNEKKDNIKSDVIFSITEDNNGTLWIGSYKGITRYNIEENHMIHYTNKLSNPYSISTNLVRCIFFSNDDILWIGTRDGGINKYDLHKGMFITYDRHYENNSNLTSNIISCIYEE
ncbi:MAG: two-component regulator propeller domain-containing protein [Melioribacteraceae bacterium]|nr:two-component regulator propeller domain-containing protein [Melioribacteraceae bacterium]